MQALKFTLLGGIKNTRSRIQIIQRRITCFQIDWSSLWASAEPEFRSLSSSRSIPMNASSFHDLRCNYSLAAWKTYERIRKDFHAEAWTPWSCHNVRPCWRETSASQSQSEVILESSLSLRFSWNTGVYFEFFLKTVVFLDICTSDTHFLRVTFDFGEPGSLRFRHLEKQNNLTEWILSPNSL